MAVVAKASLNPNLITFVPRACCRHVLLPKDLVDLVPKTHLMTETEWRSIGVQQSRGWVHYMIHEPGTCTPARCGRSRTELWISWCDAPAEVAVVAS